jgi:hypothetical protein
MKSLRIVGGMSTILLVAMVWAIGVPPAVEPPVHRLAEAKHIPPHILGILDRACLDCHSNQTRWPWYNRVPGVAQFIQHDVKKAREKVDFSAWTGEHRITANEIQDICDAVSDGTMPPRPYRTMHGEAHLSEADKNAICDWAIQRREQ